LEQIIQDLAQLGGIGTHDRFPCNQHEIVSGFDPAEMWLNCRTYDSFGSVSLDGFADRSASRHSDPDLFKVVGQVEQYNKRVGNGFAKTPHPLEV